MAMKFQEKLSTYLSLPGMNKKKMAKRAGTSPQEMGKVINHEVDVPKSVKVWMRFAELCCCSLEEFLDPFFVPDWDEVGKRLVKHIEQETKARTDALNQSARGKSKAGETHKR